MWPMKMMATTMRPMGTDPMSAKDTARRSVMGARSLSLATMVMDLRVNSPSNTDL